MSGSLAGVLLGLLVGIKHAFEPDHLTAVSALVSDAPDVRRGAWLGALWGLGHTLSLLAVGLVLLAVGVALPPRLTTAFEIAVAVMLIGLGIRAIARTRRGAPATRHRHGGTEHVHAAPDAHVHLAGRALAWRPLAVGVVHGLAGSGALTAVAFAQLSTGPSRILYITLFGLGSLAGMAATSALAGASLHAMPGGARARRYVAIATGTVSIGVGVAWLAAAG
jgi:high-affinity nickel-transport protein